MSNSPTTKSRWIKPLPKQLINKIAAGEVVERPASVLKELVENSIDSGATRIEIEIEKSGIQLIKIVDNGCGIAEDQIEIAFARHATSKISSFDELEQLLSYGFRGEALPSIASVSRMRMVSRPADQEVGTEIIFEGGVLLSKKPIAAAPGTMIEVGDLFYNTPARRKFLKAESTEARHISRYAMALAMGRSDIGFSLKLNNRNVFNCGPKEALDTRVSAVLSSARGKMIRVEGEAGPVKVIGLVGKPETAQQNRFSQFIYINNRYIGSPTLSHAIAAGYGELLPRGRQPIAVIHLSVDPAEVDVNAHPAKTEVRLSHEREIHDALFRIVRDSLKSDGLIPSFSSSVKPGNESSSSRPSDSIFPRNNDQVIPGIQTKPEVNPNFLAEIYRSVPSRVDEPAQTITVDTSTGEIVEETDSINREGPRSGFRLVGRFSDLYLLLQSGDDLYIVDQHTAHERVLYEEMLIKVERQAVDGQRLLFPVQVDLSPEQMAVFDEALEILNESGFVVAEFGGRMINIEAVPTILSKKSPERVFHKILDDIASLKKSGHDMKKAIAQSMACRAAVMAGDRLNDHEATVLIERLLQCENAYSCPHGRPTFVKLSREDIDRQFGRA